MANSEHLAILNQGVEAWNLWRSEHRDIDPNLIKAEHVGANLGGANLVRANLRGAGLIGANLHGTDLVRANLAGANLGGADLAGAILVGANLAGANLRAADLGGAVLVGANLSGANLRAADLSGANLDSANLSRAKLVSADFLNARFGSTNLGDLDLSDAQNLDTAWHVAPSTIGIDTIYRSHGKIPIPFLRGCGVPERFIQQISAILAEPYQAYSFFLSYAARDHELAQRLLADLQGSGVRVWSAPEEMKLGTHIWDRLDQSVRKRDKLILLLSEGSLAGDWIDGEVAAALHQEGRHGKTMLFPVRLDGAIYDSEKPWALEIRGRHIGDFTRWEEHAAYKKAFERLVRDIKETALRENGA